MKKVKDIIEFMEDLAPINLKEDFDNVGLMVGDKEKNVKKVLLALDCTMEVIEEAKKNNVDLILTHHPLIFKKPSSITTDTMQGRKVIELIKNDISLYSSHTNFDSVNKGLNHTITKILGFENSEILEINKNDTTAGLGRVVDLENNIELNNLIDLIKNKLNVKNMRIVDGEEPIKKIAIINGSGQGFIDKALKKGVNCVITGDTTYHFASDYKELGVTIIDIGHFSSEWITFIEAIKSIKESFEDLEFIVSEKNEDPYKFI